MGASSWVHVTWTCGECVSYLQLRDFSCNTEEERGLEGGEGRERIGTGAELEVWVDSAVTRDGRCQKAFGGDVMAVWPVRGWWISLKRAVAHWAFCRSLYLAVGVTAWWHNCNYFSGLQWTAVDYRCGLPWLVGGWSASGPHRACYGWPN